MSVLCTQWLCKTANCGFTNQRCRFDLQTGCKLLEQWTPSLVPRPHPDFISQPWRKIWVGPGDEASEHLVVQLLVHYSLVHVPQILLKTKSIYYHVLNLLCACLHVSRLSAIFRTAQWGRTWYRSRATSLMATIPRRKPMEEQCTTLSNSPPTMAPEDHWCTISRYDTHSIQDTAVSPLPSLLVPSGSTPYL